MKLYNLAIKVLVDKPYSFTTEDSAFQREVKKLGGLEKALPVITQAFIEISQRLDGKFHINQEGEISKGFVKGLPKLDLKIYVCWCDNCKNFLYSKNGAKLTAYGGKKENIPYIISIKEGGFFIENI